MTSTRGSVSLLSSTVQLPSRAARTIHVRQHRLNLHRSELEAGLGIETPDLGDHLGELLRIDANRPLQTRKVVTAEQIEVRSSLAICGS